MRSRRCRTGLAIECGDHSGDRLSQAPPEPGAHVHALAGESSEMMFTRMLADQEADVRALQSAFPAALVIWAGDFNQSFTGPNFGGSKRKRSLLVSVLERLEMSAWNANAPHAKEGMCAIDLICGPADLEVTVERVSTVHDHVVLSDHAGYVAAVTAAANSAFAQGYLLAADRDALIAAAAASTVLNP